MMVRAKKGYPVMANTSVQLKTVQAPESVQLPNLWRALFWSNGEDKYAADHLISYVFDSDSPCSMAADIHILGEPDQCTVESTGCTGNCYDLNFALRENERDTIVTTLSNSCEIERYGDYLTTPELPFWKDFRVADFSRLKESCEACWRTLEATTFQTVVVHLDHWQKAMRDAGKSKLYWPASHRVESGNDVLCYIAKGNSWEIADEKQLRLAEQAGSIYQQQKTARLQVIADVLLRAGEREENFGCITVMSKSELHERVIGHKAFRSSATDTYGEPIKDATYEKFFKKQKTFKFRNNANK